MRQYHIAILIGSLRKESFNRHLALAVIRLAPPDFLFRISEIGDLPLYNQDDDEHPAAPAERLRREIRAADGILFVTPEYNRSVPGVLKNALDHGSRPPGQNVWAKKPAGILGISPGGAGTAMAQQHLRNVLSFLDVPLLRQPEAYIQMRDGLFDTAGNIGEASRPFLQNWMNHYSAWIRENTDRNLLP